MEKEIQASNLLRSSGIFYLEVKKENLPLSLIGTFYNKFGNSKELNFGFEIAKKNDNSNDIDGDYYTEWVEQNCKESKVNEVKNIILKVNNPINDYYKLNWYDKDKLIFEGHAYLFKIEKKEILIGHYKYLG